MGRFMIPCCCLCGESADKWHDSKWRWQDFCLDCGKIVEDQYGNLVQYSNHLPIKKEN